MDRRGGQQQRCGTAPAGGLYAFFDVPGSPSRAGGARSHAHSQYNVSLSWDGLSVDPRPFARFDEHDTVTHGRRPAGCAGGRCIDLFPHPVGGIFEGAATSFGPIPMSEEMERTLAYSSGGGGGGGGGSSGAPGPIVEEPYLTMSGVVAPPVVAAPPPRAAAAAGPQCDGCLLPPRARRAINDYEARAARARRLLHAASHQRVRLQYALANAHPHGALGVDSEANPATVVYADAAARRRAAAAAAAEHERRRRDNLDALCGSPERRFGFNPFAPSAASVSPPPHRRRAEGGPGGQRKLAVPSAPGASETSHDRLFAHMAEWRPAPRGARGAARAQALANECHGGKAYDIVTGAALPAALAPSVGERARKALAHASQASLERGRNRQGAIAAL